MSNYSALILADNPIRYYRLNESAGTVAHDLSTAGQNGTLSGTITLSQTGLISGETDTCMSFDGSTGSISVPTTGLPLGPRPWSLEAWIKMPVVPGTGGHTFLFMGTASAGQAALLYVATGGQFYVGTWGGNNINANWTATTNTTYHVVATYNGTTESLYINNVLIGTLLCTPNLVQASAMIGNDPTNDWYGGLIDEVAIYSYALSAAQIQHHYFTGKNSLYVYVADPSSGKVPGLAATYPPGYVIDVDQAGNFAGMQTTT